MSPAQGRLPSAAALAPFAGRSGGKDDLPHLRAALHGAVSLRDQVERKRLGDIGLSSPCLTSTSALRRFVESVTKQDMRIPRS